VWHFAPVCKKFHARLVLLPAVASATTPARPTTTSTDVVPAGSASTGIAASSVRTGSPSHACRWRYGNASRAQGATSLTILLPVAEKLVSGRVGLVAIPAVLRDCGVHGLAIFPELLFKLFETVELFLLLGAGFLYWLRVGRLARRLRSRPARDQEHSSQRRCQPEGMNALHLDLL
jgi:hypothetical protein